MTDIVDMRGQKTHWDSNRLSTLYSEIAQWKRRHN